MFTSMLHGDFESHKEAVGGRLSSHHQAVVQAQERLESLILAQECQLKTLERRVACIAYKADARHVEERLEQIDRRLNRLDTVFEARLQAAEERLGELDARLAFSRSASKADARRLEELDARLNSLDTVFEERLTALGCRLKSLEDRALLVEEVSEEEEGPDLPTP